MIVPAAKIGTNEVALGVDVPEFGLVITDSAFPRHMFNELLLHGRMLTAEQAYARGLASELADDAVRAAERLARGLAGAVGSDAYAVTKDRVRGPMAQRALSSLDRDIDGFVRGVTSLATGTAK